ncbi:hypothetical protein A3D76_01395 [Candidatus Roizmanbacteria bacterium RIFCSPHIGHO2_02_FULL_37_9b]|nr:MAG: hypothetical protein A3D76_01395 [Candidatus Roizmanbacteria bacterium RIFCSPHIGHO2_02_FULL_37_9b]
MGKAAKGKIPLIFFNLIILIGLSIAYLVFAKNRNQQKTYFDLKTAPEAQTVEELKYLDPAVGAKASLHTDFSVSQTSRWYLDNLTGTGWVLDVPPQKSERRTGPDDPTG